MSSACVQCQPLVPLQTYHPVDGPSEETSSMSTIEILKLPKARMVLIMTTAFMILEFSWTASELLSHRLNVSHCCFDGNIYVSRSDTGLCVHFSPSRRSRLGYNLDILYFHDVSRSTSPHLSYCISALPQNIWRKRWTDSYRLHFGWHIHYRSMQQHSATG